jgi:outer membrane cobalamin receptor
VSDALQIRPITFDTVDNIADVRRQGVEVEWAHVLTSWFQDEVRYTFLENRGRPNGYSDRVELAESPRHRFDWIITLRPYRKLRVDADLKYIGSRYGGHDQSGEKQGAQATLDLRFSWPWRQADLYIGTQNTLNKRYDDVQGYPLPGRTVYGGIQLRLWG